jgi:Domain of unknown function (DUF4157)
MDVFFSSKPQGASSMKTVTRHLPFCAVVLIACIGPRDLRGQLPDWPPDWAKPSLPPIFEKVIIQLKEIDPTVKDSRVRELLRDFDTNALQPILKALKQNAIPPLFDEYLADLERQAQGRKRPLPDGFRSIVAQHYPKINLERVRYAENINTWHGQGMTVGYTIYFTSAIDLNNRDDVHWMLHELEHVTQYERVGGVSAFLLKYFFHGAIRAINNGSFNVHDDLGLERDADNKADRIIGEVANALRATGAQPKMGAHVVDLKIIAGDDPWVRVPKGFTKDPIDLNWRAGGKYIYLCVKYGTGRSISRIDVKSADKSDDPKVAPSPGYEKDPIDLNWGCGRDTKYIYLTFQRGNERILKDVMIIAGDSRDIRPPPEYSKGNNDLNEGAGGKFIFLCSRR